MDKKAYKTPGIEYVEFCYRDQVVASSACKSQYMNYGTETVKECQGDPDEGYNHDN